MGDASQKASFCVKNFHYLVPVEFGTRGLMRSINIRN